MFVVCVFLVISIGLRSSSGWDVHKHRWRKRIGDHRHLQVSCSICRLGLWCTCLWSCRWSYCLGTVEAINIEGLDLQLILFRIVHIRLDTARFIILFVFLRNQCSIDKGTIWHEDMKMPIFLFIPQHYFLWSTNDRVHSVTRRGQEMSI